MADAAETGPAATNLAQVASKKTKSSTKKPRMKPVHPRTSEMVGNAIKSLKERGSSSLQAIKKYIAAKLQSGFRNVIAVHQEVLEDCSSFW